MGVWGVVKVKTPQMTKRDSMDTYFIPRFPGRTGVSCFICEKGRSMTPFCGKHMSCWSKLSDPTKVQLIKMCEKYPADIQGLIKQVSKMVRDENNEREMAEMSDIMTKAAQSTAAVVAECNKKIHQNAVILKSLGLCP